MRKHKKILQFFQSEHQRLSPLLILTHDYPDPDALASALALQYLAEKGFGIKTRIAYGGVIGRDENREMVHILKLPVHKLRPGDFKKHASVALVDTQPAFANNSFPSNRKATIVIDQHSSPSTPEADLVVIDRTCGATSVLIARALLDHGLEIPARVATALVYGILTDTLNLFRVRRTDIFKTYLTLLPLSDIRALARIQNPSRPRKFFGGVVQGIEKAVIRRKLVISHLGEIETPETVAQMADFLLTCERITWSFCSGRFGDGLYVSLRALNPDGAAGDVLRDIVSGHGQAGGHGQIAGGRIKMRRRSTEQNWGEIEEILTQRLMRRLRIPRKINGKALYRTSNPENQE